MLADPELRLFEQQRERAERAETLLDEARDERAEAEERILGYRAGMERREAEVREVVATADALRAELVAVSAESQRARGRGHGARAAVGARRGLPDLAGAGGRTRPVPAP